MTIRYVYGFNHEMAVEVNPYSGGDQAEFMGHRQSNIDSPSDKLHLADSTTWQVKWNARDRYVDESPSSMPPNNSLYLYATAYRHSGDARDRANITFFDGHAATTPRDDVVDNVNDMWWPDDDAPKPWQ